MAAHKGVCHNRIKACGLNGGGYFSVTSNHVFDVGKIMT
jgi:K+-transporting ATPase A subunit